MEIWNRDNLPLGGRSLRLNMGMIGVVDVQKESIILMVLVFGEA